MDGHRSAPSCSPAGYRQLTAVGADTGWPAKRVM
jgi:hypothetical protein